MLWYCRVFKILHQLLTTTDAALFEKVKLALQQLNMWQVPEEEREAGARIEAEVEVGHEPSEDAASAPVSGVSEESPGGDSNSGDLLDFMFF